MLIKKLSIVIPIYNEKSTLIQLLNKVKNVDLGNVEKEYILVDDGSTDGTRDILIKMQKDDLSLKIILKERNSGKGATLKVGFEQATGDYVIVQDADLEYEPEDYKKLIQTLAGKGVDVVYGSRFSGTYKDMSGLHYFGNKMLTVITNVIFGVMLTDMETCYKLMPANLIKTINIKSSRFNFEPEVTAKILKAGLHIKEVPITYKGRTHTEGKKITWKDGVAALFTLLRFRFFN